MESFIQGWGLTIALCGFIVLVFLGAWWHLRSELTWVRALTDHLGFELVADEPGTKKQVGSLAMQVIRDEAHSILTIGPNGRIKAQVFAKSVVILGEVTGNVTATEKVDIRDNGSVDGDIAAPRVAIAEGAHFRGSIDMQKAGTSTKPAEKVDAKPAAAAPHPAQAGAAAR